MSDPVAVDVPQDFSARVKSFVALDDEIKKANKVLSELKKRRQMDKEYILEYMDDNGISELNIQNGQSKLLRRMSHTKVPLNKEYMESVGKRFHLPDEDINKMIQACFDDRDMRSKTDLSRRTVRKRKRNDD